MPNKKKLNSPWVCHDCGAKYGQYRAGSSTHHMGICSICNTHQSVTEKRDYGIGEFITLTALDIFDLRRKENN